MNLEHIESLCVNYLKQAKNPLVPVEGLLQHCRRDDDCAELTITELQEFLKGHDEIMLVEGPGAGTEIGTVDFAAAGFDMGARAILKTRVPSKSEMADMMDKQLEDMAGVLVKARRDAEVHGDADADARAKAALERIASLRERIEDLFTE